MISIPNEKLREAYWYLIHNPTGFQEGLNDIHPEMAEYLIQQGIIGKGMNSKAEFRYHLTNFGKENVEMYYNTITANLVRERLDEEKN